MRAKVFIDILPTGYLQSQPLNHCMLNGLLFCGIPNILERLSSTVSKPSILLKPSFLMANNLKIIKHSHTHPLIIESGIRTMNQYIKNPKYKLLVEENIFGLNSKKEFQTAGYLEIKNKTNSDILYFEDTETNQVSYILCKDNVGQNNILDASELYEKADFKVYFPKIHTDMLSDAFAGAVRTGLENPVNAKSSRNIANFLEISFPDLIISDAIIVPTGGGRITQRGQDLGAIIISNNAIAHDLVACQILNLDPMKVEHLRYAIDKNWGPNHLNHVEIGGVGEAGIKQLMQKTRSWRMGHYPLNQYKDKFEYENQGHRFPFEIINNNDPLAEGLLLDFLNTCGDMANSKNRLSRWTKCTICVGNILHYPKNKFIISIGEMACDSVAGQISSIQFQIKLWKIQLQSITLKNGNQHIHVKVPLNHSRFPYYRIALAFFIIGFYRNRFPLLKSSFIFSALVKILKKKRKPTHFKLTSELQQNADWSYNHILRKKTTNLNELRGH